MKVWVAWLILQRAVTLTVSRLFFFLTSGRLIPTGSDQALRELRITSALFVEEEQPQLRHLEGRLPEPPAKRQQTNKRWSLCCLWNIDFSSPVHFAGGSNPGNALPRAYKPIFYIIQQYRTQWRPATTPSLDLEIMNCASWWNKQPNTTFTWAVRQQLLLLWRDFHYSSHSERSRSI